MCFAINMYVCELTSDSRETFCRQNQKHISGGSRIKERTIYKLKGHCIEFGVV